MPLFQPKNASGEGDFTFEILSRGYASEQELMRHANGIEREPSFEKPI